MNDERSYTVAELRAVAYMAAGAAVAEFRNRHPRDVLPSEVVARAVEHTLDGLGLGHWPVLWPEARDGE